MLKIEGADAKHSTDETDAEPTQDMKPLIFHSETRSTCIFHLNPRAQVEVEAGSLSIRLVRLSRPNMSNIVRVLVYAPGQE